MTKDQSPIRVTAAVFLLFLLSGCATTGGNSDDPNDPFEGYNRAVYSFNKALDKVLVKPLARGYQAIMPAPADQGISNFFSNLGDVGSTVNNLLQFKFSHAASDASRVLLNTTVGLLGFIDIASKQNIEKYDEDFGQTLGAWGAGPGPYIVLPILGPSSGRDALGLIVDWYTDPVSYVDPTHDQVAISGLRMVDRRADLLGASKVLQEAALDEYEFVRDAYLQRRHSKVHDGTPPIDEWDAE